MPFWHGDRPGRPLELGLAIGRLVRELRGMPRPAAIGAAGQGARSRPHGRREPPAVPRRPGARDAGGAGRPHARHRALPRRTGRLARVRAGAARRPGAGAVGDGGRGADPRTAGHRRRDDVVGRWVRGAVPGHRRTAGPVAAPAAAGRGGAAAAAVNWAARRCSPRASARWPRGRCCCRAAARARARRSGSSASGHPTCSPSRRGSGRSRRCSKPTASACATSSTCRRCSTCSVACAARTMRVATVDTETAVAVRLVAAVRVHGELHLRRRRAAGRAAGAGAAGRPVAAARPARRHRTARTARRGGHRRGGSAAAAHRRAVPREERGRRCTTCCSGSATCRATRWPRAAPRTRWRDRSGRWCASGAAIEVRGRRRRRGSSRSRTRPGTATRSVCRCRRACRTRCSSRSPTRWATSCFASRARTARSPPRRSPRDSVFPSATAAAALGRLATRGRVLQGTFTPGRTGREWCENDVLRVIRQRSLARLRHEVEPVSAAALGRLSVTWHGLLTRRQGRGCAARRRRAAAGRPARRVASRARDPAGAHRGIPVPPISTC